MKVPYCIVKNKARLVFFRTASQERNMRSAPEDGASASTEELPCSDWQACLVACQWRRKMAPGQRQSHSDHELGKAQAHPPAAGGQPLPLLAQHHAFFGTDQPAIQFAKPASQSYGSEEVTHPPPWFAQPFPRTLQHHSFFATDHPACQFAKPSAQLYGSAGAAPLLLIGSPSVLGINCAIERIHRSAWCWRSCRWRGRWRSWRWSRRGCWEWRGWNSRSGLRAS